MSNRNPDEKNLIKFAEYKTAREHALDESYWSDIGNIIKKVLNIVGKVATFKQAQATMDTLFYETGRQWIEHKIARTIYKTITDSRKRAEFNKNNKCKIKLFIPVSPDEDKEYGTVDYKKILTATERQTEEFLKILFGEKDAFKSHFTTAPLFRFVPERFFIQWWESTQPVSLKDFYTFKKKSDKELATGEPDIKDEEAKNLFQKVVYRYKKTFVERLNNILDLIYKNIDTESMVKKMLPVYKDVDLGDKCSNEEILKIFINDFLKNRKNIDYTIADHQQFSKQIVPGFK